jgi:hypothetical protein
MNTKGNFSLINNSFNFYSILLRDYKPEYEKLKKKKEEKEQLEKEKQLKVLERDLKEEVGKFVEIGKKKMIDDENNEDEISNYPKISMYAKEEEEDDRIDFDDELEKGN